MSPVAIALIDGEHHPHAVRDALARLSRSLDIRAAVFCGGEEKLRPDVLRDAEAHYGVAVVVPQDPSAGLRELVAHEERVDVVLDLADEPVLGPAQKMELACTALALGLRYLGADFELRPPVLEPSPFPGRSVAVIGTGKRTGKTAVCQHWAALLRDHGRRPVIIAMGRGGPAEPEHASPSIGVDDLLAIARAGRHAASDYLEDALLAGVPTVGCRRVGGGLAGGCVESNVAAGVRAAAAQDPDIVLFEGSGATVPPVDVDATVCVVGSRAGALEHLGPYRLLRAGLALVTPDDAALVDDVARWCAGRVMRIGLRAEPVEPVAADARVAFFTTGSGDLPGVEPLVVSHNLARRSQLADDVARAAAEHCDVYVAELKAAAVDIVAAAAQAAGARLVWARNRPYARDGEDLERALLELSG